MEILPVERIKYNIKTVEKLRRYLNKKHNVKYIISGRNDEGKYWIRIHYHSSLQKSMNSGFYPTEIKGQINDTNGYFVIIFRDNGNPSIDDHMINETYENKDDLINRLKRMFLNSN